MTQSVIVGDIGGTNGRLAVATLEQGVILPVVGEMHTYPSGEFAGLGEMIKLFMKDIGLDGGIDARIAIAGPTCGHLGHLTNLNWSEDAGVLEDQLKLKSMKFLNDFEALAFAAGCLSHPYTKNLKDGHPVEGCPVSVMGPGTGFGVAQLLKVNNKFHVVATEGGHTSFAPVTRLEEDMVKYLHNELDHVSVETLMSGAGLQRIHRFLVDYGGSGNKDMRPSEISAAAIEGSQISCQRAVQLFLSILGSVAGDIVLTQGGRGGVVFGGGILPKLVDLLDRSDLATRFVAKGPMRHYLENVPIKLITSPDAALVGAAVSVG